MTETTPSPLNNVITIDDDRIKNHLNRVVRGSVEETLNAGNAQRYERSAARRDTRAGHYERNLQTKAGGVRLKRSFASGRSRRQPFHGFPGHLQLRPVRLSSLHLVLSDHEPHRIRICPLARLSRDGGGAAGYRGRLDLACPSLSELRALREAVSQVETAVCDGRGAGASTGCRGGASGHTMEADIGC